MFEAKSDITSLDRGSKFYEDQLRTEIFKMRIRKDALTKFSVEESGSMEIPDGVLADDPLPEAPAELIPGVLLAHGCTGIVGCKETGKSLISLEIQHSLLTGEPLWGSIVPNTVINKSVHLLAEHASPILMQLYQRTGLSKTGKANLRIFGPEHLAAMKLLVSNGIRREEAVSFYKKIVDGAGLVVFDPLSAYIQGLAAENDNAPMRTLIDAMIEIAQSTGAACLVLAHQGKPTFFQGKMMKRSSYATRGASSSEDAMSGVHYLDREAGVSIDGKPVFELKPVHWKGWKQKPFLLLRDTKTMRHTLKSSG